MKILNPTQYRCRRNLGQATTEFAIMGAIVLTGLLFLAQQGLMYNARQGLEMYTFRKALELSQKEIQGGKRAIDLTVIRDIPTPSFFSSINRQRVMASASVSNNPYELWSAEADTPGDIGTYQLLQIGEGMIQKGHFVRVPPSKIKVVTKDGSSKDWSWTTSSPREIDSQVEGGKKISGYKYTKRLEERPADGADPAKHRIDRQLESTDTADIKMTFEKKARIEKQYKENDWESNITNVEVEESSIPQDIQIVTEEVLRKQENIETYAK